MRGIGDWTPFFVRILAPKARAAVRPVLFDDGYLEGVLRRQPSPFFLGEDHDRLDDWAHDVLALTPILEPAELDRLRMIGKAIKSEGTRKAFEAGLAVGYAACGQMSNAYELIRWTRYETTVILTSALADVVTQIPTDALPEWLTQVHSMVSDPYDRGPLWAIMNDRWPELTREQLWKVLDRWTSELAHGSRFNVCADILHYKYAIRALAGPRDANVSWSCSRSAQRCPATVPDDRGGPTAPELPPRTLSITITAETYAHVLPELTRETAEAATPIVPRCDTQRRCWRIRPVAQAAGRRAAKWGEAGWC